MKATELMVGNIVKHPEGYTMTVFGIKGGYATGVINVNDTLYDSQQKIKNLSPIPITEELLVKNGFTKKDDCYRNYYIYVNEYKIEVHFGSCAAWRVCYVTIEEPGGDQIAGNDINHLHQLQNLLNIMDIKLDFVV